MSAIYPSESLYPGLLLFPEAVPVAYADGAPLAVRIRIAFGASIAADPATWVWTDVTDWWHAPDEVQISWGRSSGAEQPETSRLSLTLKNTDGRFTAYDPRSPYWPNVRRWTPISYDVDLNDGQGWRNRFSGYIRKWPLTWPGNSPFMALAKIDAVGLLGRLSRGKPPERSAMRRTIAASTPAAYWPVEDGADAGQAASALPGHQPLAITGTVSFSDIEAWTAAKVYPVVYGTAALADISKGATLRAQVPADVTAATASGWTLSITCDFPVGSDSTVDLVLAEIETPGGTFVRWQLVVVQAAFDVQLIAYDANGTATVVFTDTAPFSTLVPHNLAVWQNGANISAGYIWDSGIGYEATGTVAGTLTGVTTVAVNPTGATATVSVPVGHIALWPGHDLPVVDFNDGDVLMALYSWSWEQINRASGGARGEQAVDRLARLCAEDGVTLTVPAVDAAEQVRMGPQKAATPLALYQDCETADLGLIYEAGFGLGYLPRPARYNAPVTLTIDAAAGQIGAPFEPVDDDQALRNRWTVDRVDGSSAVAEDQESIDLQGVIEGSATINLASDTPLPDHAGWRLHLSTVQEPRYPAMSLNLAAHPELAAAWCGCQPGSRVQVVNPPQQNVPGVVDQLLVGATETYRGRRSWRATLNVMPASPWQVATVDGQQRVAADGTTLTSGITASALSVQITSTGANGAWTTAASDFPVDLRIGGERVTATGITGTGLTQTVTLSARAVNGVARSWPTGTEVDVWQPAVAAL